MTLQEILEIFPTHPIAYFAFKQATIFHHITSKEERRRKSSRTRHTIDDETLYSLKRGYGAVCRLIRLQDSGSSWIILNNEQNQDGIMKLIELYYKAVPVEKRVANNIAELL